MKKRYLNITFGAFALLAVVACASAGRDFDDSAIRSFERGKTTYAEVVARLGPPVGESFAADGTRSITYTYASAVALGGTQSKTATLSFDPTGILTETSLTGIDGGAFQ